MQRELKRLSRKADRFVFCAMAWQAEGVTDPSVRAEDHPDRFEVALIQAVDMERGREEVWRARVERQPDAPPQLGVWERAD